MKLKRYISALTILSYLFISTLSGAAFAASEEDLPSLLSSGTQNASYLDSAFETLNLITVDTVWDVDFNSHTLSGTGQGSICDSEGVTLKNSKNNYLEVKSTSGNSDAFTMAEYTGDASKNYGNSLKLNSYNKDNTQLNYFQSVVDSNYAVFSYDCCVESLTVDKYIGSIIFYNKSGGQVGSPTLKVTAKGELYSGEKKLKTLDASAASKWFNVVMVTNLDTGMYYVFIDGTLLDTQDLSSLNISKTYKFMAYVRVYNQDTGVIWFDNYKVLEVKALNEITKTENGDKYIDITFSQPIDTVEPSDVALSFGKNKLSVASITTLSDKSVRVNTVQEIFSAVDIDIEIFDQTTKKTMNAVHASSHKEFDMGNVSFQVKGDTLNVSAKVYNSTGASENVVMIVVLKNALGQILKTVGTADAKFTSDDTLGLQVPVNGAVYAEVFFVDDYTHFRPLKNIKFEKLLDTSATYQPTERTGDASFYFDGSEGMIVAGGTPNISAGETTALLVTSGESGDMVMAELFSAEKNGVISKAVSLPEGFATGMYQICIGIASGTNSLTGTVVVYDHEDTGVKTLIGENNDAESADGLLTLMKKEENKNKLVFHDETFGDKAVKLCYSLKSKLSDKKFTADSFARTYRYALAATKLSEGENSADILKQNEDLLAVDYEAYSESELKDEIDSLFTKIDWSKKFYTYDEISVIAYVRTCDNVSALWDYVLDDSNPLSISDSVLKKFDALSTLKEQNEVFSDMIEKTADIISIEEAEDLFEDAIDACSKPSKSSGGSGFSGKKAAFDQDVSLPLEPIENAETQAKFSDIETHWAKDDIVRLTDLGIISGYEDGTYRPDSFVTRAELSKLVSSLFDISESGTEVPFTDVAADDWFFETVSALYKWNIVNGSENKFYPNRLITRQDAVTIMSRVLAIKGVTFGESEVSFDDMNLVSDYAQEGLRLLGSLNIVQGDNNKFNPKNNLSRAEIAAMISRIATIMGV